MTSPHGSKSWELIKYVANRVLTARQRHLIKSALGIGARVEGTPDIRNELERIKSRQTLLDGKFNLAIHGLPTETQTKALILSNSLLAGLGAISELDDFFLLVLEKNLPSREKLTHLLRHTGTALVIGADFPEIVKMISATHLTVCESTDFNLRRARAAVSDANWMQTDPLTCILSQQNVKFGLIACLWRFHHLTPREQVRFVHAASESLDSGGCLILVLPVCGNDSYWTDPRALRPYSVEMIQELAIQFFGSPARPVDLGARHVAFRLVRT